MKLARLPGLLIDRMIRRLDRRIQPNLRGLGRDTRHGRVKIRKERISRQIASHLTRGSSSHAVTHHKSPDLRCRRAGIFIAMANAAAVGKHSVNEVIGRHSSSWSRPKRKIHAAAVQTKGTLVLGAGDVGMNRIVHGDNLNVLQAMAAESVELIYVDPPFNTGRRQARTQMKTVRDKDGDRTGFGGHRYRTEILAAKPGSGYGDSFDDFLGFLRPRLVEAHRILSTTGSLFFHIDYREVHYCKVMLDEIFGRDCFQNEIIWAYDYGARATKRWPAKHDNILWYTKHPTRYTFNLGASDRIPYRAPGLVGAEKAARGKTPTDVWWHTIVSPTGKEKTGYATQKPLGILERIVRVHSNPGETVMDFFAGSGTTAAAAAKHGRSFVMVDESAAAIAVMEKRLAPYIPQRENSSSTTKP
jgi:site-specific DNA-methyltransferase (adenine-specific)